MGKDVLPKAQIMKQEQGLTGPEMALKVRSANFPKF